MENVLQTQFFRPSYNTVCNFQSMKSPAELNSLLPKFFFFFFSIHDLIRRDTGVLANEAFTSNPIVCSKQ